MPHSTTHGYWRDANQKLIGKQSKTFLQLEPGNAACWFTFYTKYEKVFFSETFDIFPPPLIHFIEKKAVVL